MRLTLAICILTVLTACSGSGPDARVDVTVETLAGRFDAVRGAIEEVIGEPYGEPPVFRETTRKERVDAMTAELVASHAAIVGGPRGADLRTAAARNAAVLTVIRPLLLDPKSGEILFDRAAFEELSRSTSEGDRVLSRGFLDVLVIHEAVRLRDHRVHDSGKLLGAPASEETLLCRESVLEGHAQYVGRRAVEPLGLPSWFELLRRVSSLSAPLEPATAERDVRKEALLRLGLTLVQGERFIDDLVVKLGYGEAIGRAFAAPPRTLAELRDVTAYLERPEDPPLARLAATALEPMLRREGFRVEFRALPAAELWAACGAAGEEAVKQGLREVVDACVLTVTDEKDPHRTLVLLIVDARTEEGAGAYLELNRKTLAAKVRALPEGTKVLASKELDAGVEGAQGFFLDWTIEAPGEIVPFKTLAVRRGRHSLEISARELSDGHEDLRRLAGRILAALRD